MKCCCLLNSKFGLVLLGAVGASAIIGGSLAFAQDSKDPKGGKGGHGTAPEMSLPPGWTEADMKACMDAGTPGPMHDFLKGQAGTWKGKSKQWMMPDSEPMLSECTCVIAPMMDGRFVKTEMSGEMPGMGPFSGFGLVGYDNVAKQFQGSWIDNHGTGIMQGTGTLSADGKTLTWEYKFNCPLTKKVAVMREIERITGPNSKTMEMHMADPKSGKEFKMMEIAFTR